MQWGTGLANVSTLDLKALLRAVHRGQLTCPVTPKSLAECGLLRLGDDVEHLKGLDASGVRAVIVAVLAERDRR